MDSVHELINARKVYIWNSSSNSRVLAGKPFKIDYAWKAKRIGKRVTELKDIFPKAMLN